MVDYWRLLSYFSTISLSSLHTVHRRTRKKALEMPLVQSYFSTLECNQSTESREQSAQHRCTQMLQQGNRPCSPKGVQKTTRQTHKSEKCPQVSDRIKETFFRRVPCWSKRSVCCHPKKETATCLFCQYHIWNTF